MPRELHRSGTPPTVSIVIPTKNAGGLFRSVLQAVITQQTNWPYEVLVIDSGSTDGTVGLVKEFPSVRLLEIPPESFGHGRTRNLGVTHTRGELIAFITQDALPVNSHWLENLTQLLFTDTAVAGVFGRHLAYDNASPFVKRDLTLHFDHLASWPNPLHRSDAERYEKDQGYRQVLHFFSDNNACIRRVVWQDFPYPDVDFAEDQIWAKQIIEAGFKKGYSDSGAVYHSHNYSVIESFRRAFDEAFALRQLFGYRLAGSLKTSLSGGVRGTLGNWSYLYSINLPMRQKIRWALRTPWEELAKHLGHYLANRPKADKMFGIMSLDNSFKAGRRQ